MKFKTENLFMFVEGIQFINGDYSTTDKNEIETLKRYADTISIVEDEKPSKKSKKIEQ